MCRYKKSTAKHIIVKLIKTKDKKKIIKGSQGNDTLAIREKAIWMTVDFILETREVKRIWHTISQVLKEKGRNVPISKENILQA